MPSISPRIYRTNGNDEGSTPANDGVYTLEELQAIVGGHIEIVALSDGRLMVCNEEGKLLGLPFNAKATALFAKGGRMWFDPVAGDVLVCAPNYLEADDDDDDEPDGDTYSDV